VSSDVVTVDPLPDVVIPVPPASVKEPAAGAAADPSVGTVVMPPDAVLAMLIDPAPGVIVMFDPAVKEAGTGSAPVEPIRTSPSFMVAVVFTVFEAFPITGAEFVTALPATVEVPSPVKTPTGKVVVLDPKTCQVP
jgi:hypothetical protein